MQRLALLLCLVLVACGSVKLHESEAPKRRFGGTFIVPEVGVDESVKEQTAREDAAALGRELRGALAVVARDGAGDERFLVLARVVGYEGELVVAVDIVDRRNARIARFEVSAPASKRGWTDAARETARFDVVQAIAQYLQSNR